MSNIKNELITKLRSDIRTKLDQIGAFVDNELADYIMVLVANQKSKYQMKDDLSLFLGATTDEFVNWLHTTLKQIQLNATQNEDQKTVTPTDDKVVKETKDLPKKSDLSSKPKHKKLFRHSSKSSDKNGRNSVEDSLSVNNKTNEDLLKVSNEANNRQISSDENQNKAQNERLNHENDRPEDDAIEVKELNEGDVVLHLNPDGGDVDELLQENDVNDGNKFENKNQTKDESTKEPKVVSSKRQQMPLTPSSAIGAVVVNKPKKLEDEDDYDQSRPIVGSVASVVRVTQRKSSVPIELQANKNLLIRAVKDANESLNPNRKRAAESLDYTPTPIKKRLGDKPEVVSNDVIQRELDPKDLRHYLKVSKKDSDKNEELDPNLIPETKPNLKRKVKQLIECNESEERDPQFVVTLDGVDHNKYLQNNDYTDRILFDEEMDEELVESEDLLENENMENNDLNIDKVNERCRFWPSCKNGDECEFIHPDIPCKTFPNCRFGDKCIYIHPNCKFDSMCSRRDCPFTHASRRKIATSAAIISGLLAPTSTKQCKYMPNCKNPNCPYYHPKICRFGGKCRSNGCPFIHPTPGYSSAQPPVPHPNQLKWKAKDHISDRQFAIPSDKSLKTS